MENTNSNPIRNLDDLTFEELTEFQEKITIKLEEMFKETENPLNWAAKNGYIGVCKWLAKLPKDDLFMNKIYNDTSYPLNYAAEYNHLELVKWLYFNAHSIKAEFTPEYFDKNSQAICYAAREGHLQIVKWLTENTHLEKEEALAWASQGGHIDIVKYLYVYLKGEINKDILSKMLEYACQKGHLDVVKFIKNVCKNVEITSDSLYMACQNGHIAIIKWLHKTKPELFKECETMKIAAYNNHIDVVIWLYWNTVLPSRQETKDIIELCKERNVLIVEWLNSHNSYYYRISKVLYTIKLKLRLEDEHNR